MSNWSASQLSYARTIIAVGKQRRATDRDIATALMVALTESSMQNLANPNVPESLSIPHDGLGNDHASVGLFQQQVGIWGDAQTLMDPAKSASLFYDKLLNIPARDHLAPWQLAQTIQRSAFPDGSNYRSHMDESTQLLQDAGGGNGDLTGILPGQPGNGAESVLSWMVNPKNWQRVGLGILGALLLLIALWKWLKNSSAVQSAVGTAKRAAELAVL